MAVTDPDPPWPEALLGHLARSHGSLSVVEPLGGMSAGRVWRARFPAGTLIVKMSPSPAEARFYARAAPRLRAAGVPIPDLLWSLRLPGAHWLALEDIPTPLPVPPADAWRPDPRVVAILARLHATTRGWSPDLPDARPQAWTDADTAGALACFPTPDGALARRLRAVQAVSERLAEPWCWISGDPNPRNWGLRADGTPALFDWELFGPGLPAADLAIIIPGLGDAAAYSAAAGCYRATWDASQPLPLPWASNVLARDIAVAKVASVVRLLHGHAAGTARVDDELVAWLVEAVPPWLAQLA